jgi:polysaccharide biosynthesis protein PslE
VAHEGSVDWFASLSFSDVLRTLWRQRYSILAVSACMAPILLLVVYLLPVKYDSDAQLLVRLGRNTLSSDPTSSITPTVSVQESRLSQVSSVKEMLESRALAEQIVESVGADKILEPHGFVESTISSLMRLLPSLGGSGGSGGPLTAEQTQAHLKKEEAVAKLQDSIELTTAKNAYTIHVRIRSGSPYLSQALLSALIEQYQLYHVHAYRSGGALDFFEAQTSQAYQQAVATKEKVRQAKDQMGIIEIEAARSALREQLSQAQRELDTVDSELAATKSEVQRYESEMASMPQRVKLETITGITSNPGDGMRQQLYTLELQAKELAAKLHEDHPALKAVREQLASATKIADSERREQPQNRESINPVFQQFEVAYRSALVRRDGLQAKRQSLQQHLVDLEKKIVELNRNEVELTKLNWEATLAENVYLQNAESRDRARLLVALDREGLSEISVVQPASLQLKKASPKRGILAVASLMLALGIGVLQGLLRAWMVMPVKEPEQITSSPDGLDDIDLKPRLVSHSAEQSEYALRVSESVR